MRFRQRATCNTYSFYQVMIIWVDEMIVVGPFQYCAFLLMHYAGRLFVPSVLKLRAKCGMVGRWLPITSPPPSLARFYFFPSYNWVLYSPRGSASQCNRTSDQPDLHIGNVGTAGRWTLQREDRLLQAASRRERSLRFRSEDYQTEWHAFRVGRAQKVDRIPDLGISRDQSRWRAPELSYLGQNSRGRYVSRILTESLSVYLRLREE